MHTFRSRPRSGARPKSLWIAASVVGAVLVWSPGALAAAGCTTTTPSIGQTIVCSTAGSETITIPVGADTATAIVIGAGGASGRSELAVVVPEWSGAGGNGARVTADLNVSTQPTLSITVGAGGSTTSLGGNGGGFSSISLGSSTVIVAGGGGGGAVGSENADGSGGSGGNGSAAGTSAGGAGGDGPGSGFLSGGSGGASGVGGPGGGTLGTATTNAGASWAAGGAGGTRTNSGGGGGGGYGGGGSGGTGDSDTQGAAGGGAGGSFADPSLAWNITFSALGVLPGTNTPGAGGQSVRDVFGYAGKPGSITITFYITTTPSGPTSSSSSAAARSTSLDFTLPADVTCAFDSVEASLGSWIQLPAASDCTITPRAGGESPTLLGWATQEDFPVAIAQHQVDNGWGAYETYGDDSVLTGVFIPAGGYTTVSNDTNLYPIWSL